MSHRVKHSRSAKLSGHRPPAKHVVCAVFQVRPALPHKRMGADLGALSRQLPARRRYMTVEEAVQACGSSPDAIEKVAAFARRKGFKILGTDPAAGQVVVEGTVARYEKEFGIEFVMYHHPRGEYRSYKGEVRLPGSIRKLVIAVIGLDNRSMAAPHLHHHPHPKRPPQKATEVARIYRVPPDSSGKGQCIGIVTLGGGFYRSDITQYFQRIGLPEPKVDIVLAEGAENRPAKRREIRRYMADLKKAAESGKPPEGGMSAALQEQIKWTIETTLDIQLAGTFAPGARIVLYLGHNTESGKIHALANAVMDTARRPSVISCSWGSNEKDSTSQYLHTMESLIERAALCGITVCASSGDDGSPLPVYYPASSRYVLACGGTSLNRRGNRESVWLENLGSVTLASTGGFSSVFRAPEYQEAVFRKLPKEYAARRSGRGVPDVAAKADLLRGYLMTVGGADISMGGTSAAAPAWAGLIACLNEMMGENAGFLNALLYGRRYGRRLRMGMRDIVKGGTQAFKARHGWDACTGWGSPIGIKLLKALQP